MADLSPSARARKLLAREGLLGSIRAVLRIATRRLMIEPLQRFWRLSKRDLVRGRRTLRVGGLLMDLPSDMAWAFPDGRYYERNVEFWFRRMLGAFDRPVVYDVGANYGYYTLIAASGAAKVISFEPVSPTFAVLKRNVERNHLAHVLPLKLAVGDQPGYSEITLYNSSGNNSAVPRATEAIAHLEVEGSERVEVVSLDQLVARGAIPPPDVIKIDIEGSELAAVRGAREVLEKHQPTVIMEHEESIARDAGYSLTDIRAELAGLGYQVLGLRDPSDNRDRDDCQLYSLDASVPASIGTLVGIPSGVDGLLPA
jgi:FkbM family methyltransferase